jgi:hypothetical protein
LLHFDYVPSDKCYVGSLCAWLPYSIQYTTAGFLTDHITNSSTQFSALTLYGGCIVQILVAAFLGGIVGLIVLTSILAAVFTGLVSDVMLGRRHKGGFTNFVKEIIFHF